MQFRSWLGAAAVAASVGFCANAHAGVIFDNFGPGGTYFTSGGTATSVDPAMGFTSSSAADLTQIDLVVTHGLGASTAAQVSLLTDKAGKPGHELGSWQIPNAPDFFTPSVSTISGITGIRLRAGKSYWLQVEGVGDFVGPWHYNSIGGTGPVHMGPGFLPSTKGTQSVFDVIGTAAVPEPGVWTMMIVGLSGLGGLLRARRRMQSAQLPA